MDKKELRKAVDVEMPTNMGTYQLHLFHETVENIKHKEHLALVMGNVRQQASVLTRIHSECCTGDIFGCQRCDCQDQLQEALKMIRRAGQGVLLYLRQEGRGIGLENKLHAYKLQDQGMDTVEANIALGFGTDERNYEIAASMLTELDVRSVRLLTNNTNKVNGLVNAGIPVIERVPLVFQSSIRNRTSLFKTKQKKLGHVFDGLEEKGIIDTSACNEKLPFSYPDLFLADAPLPESTIHLCELIGNACQKKFGDNLLSVLFQGSNMRGDASPFDSDFDYILMFKEENEDIFQSIAELKIQYPQCNFLFLSGKEYQSYKDSAKLQFFITRKICGSFNLGLPPGRSALFETAHTYAVQINNAIRPLIFEFLDQNANHKALTDRAHVCLKRFDDCFLRVLSLLKMGKYPLNRSQLMTITTDQSIEGILDLLNRWYGGSVTMMEVCEGLKSAEKILHEYITQST